MRIIDSHIHLDKYQEGEIHKLLENTTNIQKLISVSYDLESCKKNLALSRQYPQVKAAFGYHPEQKLPSDKSKTTLFEWMEKHKDEMIAIGEVGLPYYLKQSQQISQKQYEQYKELLESFIQRAALYQKPLALHAVYEDASEVCNLLEKYSIKRAHFHWFKGDPKTIKRMIANGYYISITPEVVYKEKIQRLAADYPIDQMMIETDGPWPFEGPFRGKRTHPIMMLDSIKIIAKIAKRTVEETAEILYQNTTFFYQIPEEL